MNPNSMLAQSSDKSAVEVVENGRHPLDVTLSTVVVRSVSSFQSLRSLVAGWFLRV